MAGFIVRLLCSSFPRIPFRLPLLLPFLPLFPLLFPPARQTTMMHRLTSLSECRYVALLSGEAIISIPETGQSVRIEGGKDGLIIAADTKDVSVRGHRTVYPGAEQTVAISIPVREGRVPEHVVVEER